MDEGDWKKESEKIEVIQKCPRCGKLSLKFRAGKLLCSECGFDQKIGDIS